MYTRGYTPGTPAIWRGQTARIRTSDNGGIRPTTSRSLEDCGIKDSAHFKRKLSMKITQVKAELFAMNEKIKELNADEKRTDYRAKQAKTKAMELTQLQELLSDHFTALDKANMRITISEVVKESATLKEANDSVAREREEIYASRMDHEQEVEKLKKELGSVISNTALRGVQQAVQNDPKKTEQVKMELQLWELIQERESLMRSSKLEYNDTSYTTGIESDIFLLHNIIGNKLNDVSNSICNVSKLEQYESIMSENHMNRVQNYAPQQSLNYLECYLSYLKNLDKYVTKTIKQLTAKCMDLKGMCVNSLDVSSLDDALGRRMTNLKSKKSIIECQRLTSCDKLNTKEVELRVIEKQLMANEHYKKQQELENKLRNVNGMNHSIEEYLEEGRSLNDLHKCKERVLNTINSLNATIISNLNQQNNGT